jgi:hypothetical protein
MRNASSRMTAVPVLLAMQDMTRNRCLFRDLNKNSIIIRTFLLLANSVLPAALSDTWSLLAAACRAARANADVVIELPSRGVDSTTLFLQKKHLSLEGSSLAAFFSYFCPNGFVNSWIELDPFCIQECQISESPVRASEQMRQSCSNGTKIATCWGDTVGLFEGPLVLEFDLFKR